MLDFSSNVNDFQANSEVSPSLRQKARPPDMGSRSRLISVSKSSGFPTTWATLSSQFAPETTHSSSGNGSDASRTRRRPSPRLSSIGCAAFGATCGVASPLARAIAPWQSQMGSASAHRSGGDSSKSPARSRVAAPRWAPSCLRGQANNNASDSLTGA